MKKYIKTKEEKMTEAETLECYNCEKKCDEEKMPYSKVWIGKVCDECYEEEEEEIEVYEVECFDCDCDMSTTLQFEKDDYQSALDKFNWMVSRGGLRRNEYTGKATYCKKIILYGVGIFGDMDEIKVWEKKKIKLNIVKGLSEDPKFIKKLADEIGEENAKYYDDYDDEEHRKHLIECVMKSKYAGTGDDFTDKEKFPIHLLEEIQRQVFKEYAEDNLLPWGQERDIAIEAFYKEHFNDD